MFRFKLPLRRASLLLCSFLLLSPQTAAAAESPFLFDFDGDGQRDRITLNHQQPSVIEIWLSASKTFQRIESRVPLMRVIATDLDGDHRPELVVSDHDLQIHVWTGTRKGFRSYLPGSGVPKTRTQSSRHSVADDDSEPGYVIASSRFTPFAPAACGASHTLHLEYADASLTQVTGPCSPLASVGPFAPRPPPATPSL